MLHIGFSRYILFSSLSFLYLFKLPLICQILFHSSFIHSLSSTLFHPLTSPLGDYIEKQTRTIRLDHISAAVLKEVIHFCTQECQENSSFLQSLPSPSPRGTQEGTYIGNKDEKVLRTSFVFELKPETVMELMSAAEYLQIPSLISHIINMLAAYADGTTLTLSCLIDFPNTNFSSRSPIICWNVRGPGGAGV